MSAAARDDAGAAQAEGASEGDVIIVRGRAQEFYRVTETVSGRLPSEPLESPISIQAINAQLIHDQGARDAQDLYRNISGVSVFSYAGVTARGFRQEGIFFDGLRGDPYSGFSVPQLFNVERVEFLKGPAGMLYGPGAPGGVFNYITKRPDDVFSARATGVVGTEGRAGASLELTGALPIDGSAGRLGLFYEDRSTARVGAESAIGIAEAGASFDLGGADLLLQATHYSQNLPANRLRGVPVDDQGRFIADRRWNHNEPRDFLDLRSTTVSARLDAELFEGVTWDISARYNPSRESQEYHEPRGLLDTDLDGVFDTTTREYRDQSREYDKLSIGTNAIWETDFGAVENRLLVGADYFDQELDFEYFRARLPADGVPNLSLVDPVYGLADPSTYDLTDLPTSSFSSQSRAGGNILNEATLGRFIGLVGARFDSFDDEVIHDTLGRSSFSDEALTWRAGLVYRMTDEVSLFSQWAESFEPQGAGSQVPEAGGPFDPTEGEMFEAGAKTALFGGAVQSTASIYQIKRTNIVQDDPRGDVGGDGTDDLIAFGEVTSEGFEIDLAADLTDDWVLTFSYGYNDTRITADNGGGGISNRVGDRFANAPEHQAGFWTRYQIPRANLALALGGDYVDVRESLSGQKVRPYVVFDASIIYEAGPWSALLRIDNLADETYASSGFVDRTGHFPGEPRTVFLELAREW